jgi:methylmalonyl-CoA/ethylmalonyl-CoA epimerase
MMSFQTASKIVRLNKNSAKYDLCHVLERNHIIILLRLKCNFNNKYKTFNMNISHIEHLGIAVDNLEDSIKYYENVLGLKCYAIEEVVDQKVKTAFFLVGNTKIELLESTSPEGPIGKFIAKKGPGIHHIAFAVHDATQALKLAEQRGVTVIDKESRKGAEGLNIGFLHPKSTQGVLTELCSKS